TAEKDSPACNRFLCRVPRRCCSGLLAGRVGLVTSGCAGRCGDCSAVEHGLSAARGILEMRMLRMRFGASATFLILIVTAPLCCQTRQEDTLAGPDTHEIPERAHAHLFGEWGGERTRLQERGVRFDFQYITDTLWNVKSVQKERVASFNRVRGTVDIDFGALSDQPGLYFHATAVWQGGGNLGTYLGLITGPSGMSSQNTFRLDSWWFEKRWLNERVIARVGQFAEQDFYGTQHYGASL